MQKAGKVCVLDIDVQGVQKIKRTDINPHLIFIAPPSPEQLEARLRGRCVRGLGRVDRPTDRMMID